MKVGAIQTTDPVTGASSDTAVEQESDFNSVLQTSATLDQIFAEASQTYGVPKDLLKAIAKAESDFNPSATSHCGAQGIMQLMPGTAAELGVTDAYDPYQNIMGGSKYIAQLMDKYDGNITLALAAYNAGSNNVAKYGGVPPFEETQNYVVKVTGYMNDGINVPNISYAVAGTHEDSYYEGILNDLFSYEDYLDFLDLYMKVQESESSKEKKEQEEDKETNSYHAYQGIKYSPTVMNLIGGTEGI